MNVFQRFLLFHCLLQLTYISGRAVSVDVGLCRSHCGVTIRPPHEAGQQEYLKHSSMLEFLKNKKMRTHRPAPSDGPEGLNQQVTSCGVNQVCEPAGVRVERVLLFEGPREVEVIQECHCEMKLTQCVRVPSLKTYYSGTPYETVLDVGRCSWSKGSQEGFSCVPINFDSALLESPNKVDLIRTVASCELKESCYRAPFVEHHYEIDIHADGVKEEKLKEVDVGRCLGGCTTGSRCLLRNPNDAEMCLLWSESVPSSCVPQGYENHSFISQDGQKRSILSITSCQCQE
ncbi:uncharacterized protein pnhd isoform X2 [Austrofundulus limnaeus]|uniref:Uncharacterized protein pnhd isoform X2 n=1 Tax=Austrofundulus limnaeus TaxID=52670 RepID=A0A2I4B576_AUSLI|nr:PREDICTED: uncharacterized protein LOC106516873 isoform X2 [Austrofundulus limnaeus]